MNKILSFTTGVLASASIFLGGCCNDPAIVKIPNADASAPVLHWEVTVLTQTPSGPISSLTQHADPDNNITVHSTDEVAVYLVAVDNESGIKKISTHGRFGYTCTGPGGPAIVDGFLPNQALVFNDLSTCGLKQWRFKRECFDVAFHCNAGTISNRSIGLAGDAENFKGGGASINLTIQVVD